jgi:membrane protease YdiL (CAAX protease family)
MEQRDAANDAANDAGSAAGSEAQALFDVAVAFVAFMMLPVVGMQFFDQTNDLVTRVENGSLVLLCGIVPLLVFAWLRRAVLPVRLKTAWSIGRYGGFLVIWVPLAMFAYPYLVHLAGQEFQAQEPVRYYAASPGGPGFWLAVIVTCVGAPLAEEISSAVSCSGRSNGSPVPWSRWS